MEKHEQYIPPRERERIKEDAKKAFMSITGYVPLQTIGHIGRDWIESVIEEYLTAEYVRSEAKADALYKDINQLSNLLTQRRNDIFEFVEWIENSGYEYESFEKKWITGTNEDGRYMYQRTDELFQIFLVFRRAGI